MFKSKIEINGVWKATVRDVFPEHRGSVIRGLPRAKYARDAFQEYNTEAIKSFEDWQLLDLLSFQLDEKQLISGINLDSEEQRGLRPYRFEWSYKGKVSKSEAEQLAELADHSTPEEFWAMFLSERGRYAEIGKKLKLKVKKVRV
jgi:hypothetical protein